MFFIFVIDLPHDDITDVLSDVSDTSYISDFEDQPNSVQYDLSNGSPLDINKFIVAHFNVNSILAENRLDEVQSVCSTLNIAVLCITESKLDETIPSSVVMLQGYHEPIRRDRILNGRQGGGCLMYISENLLFKHRTDLQTDHFEHLWADIKVGGLNFTVTCFYRPQMKHL